MGKQFKVVTDCNAIKTCSTKRDILPQIARWWLLLQEFSIGIEHRAGTKMKHVDALSRNAISEAPVEIIDNFIFYISTDDWLISGQLTDLKLQEIKDILEKAPEDDYERRIHREFKLVNHLIYRVVKRKTLWVVPQKMRREIVRMAHDEVAIPLLKRQ